MIVSESEASKMVEGDGKGLPLLLVLSVDSGLEFPSSSQSSSLKVKMNPLSKSLINCGFQVRARLNEAWLESGEVAASSNPHFGTELAWEVGGQNYDFFPSRLSGH